MELYVVDESVTIPHRGDLRDALRVGEFQREDRLDQAEGVLAAVKGDVAQTHSVLVCGEQRHVTLTTIEGIHPDIPAGEDNGKYPVVYLHAVDSGSGVRTLAGVVYRR